jgi:glycosyltransferase involved in cell wall biosynthesis
VDERGEHPRFGEEQADVDQQRARRVLAEILRRRQPRQYQEEAEGQRLGADVADAGEADAADDGLGEAAFQLGVGERRGIERVLGGFPLGFVLLGAQGVRRLAAQMVPAGRRLRVLTMVDGPGTAGGGEGIARQIALHLDPARFEVVFCVTHWSPEIEPEADLPELREAGIAFVGIERSGRFDLRPWRQLIGRARASGIDVIHTHKIGSNLWGALLKGPIGAPVFVAHEHTWSYEGQPARVLADRELIARRADAFVAVSEEDRRRMVTIEGVPPTKARFIPNGIPPFPPPTPGRDVRAELGVGPEVPLVGVVATLRPQKALEVMIEAVPALRRAVPGATVLLIGGTDSPGSAEEARLREAAAAAEVGDAVRFLGARDDVPDLVAALDLGALSSDFEGSPLSVMEYMEAGKAVVATRVGGLPELVVEGETGLLVPPRDPTALAAAMAELLNDPDRRARMGEAGRRRRRDRFSIEATAAQIGALYEELLEAR